MLKKNLLSVGLSVIVASLVSFLLLKFSHIRPYHWYMGIAVFTPWCLILNYIFTRNLNSPSLTGWLIGASVVKLLLALIVIVVYLVINREGFFNFSIHFIIHYILFTIFETAYLLDLLKQKKPTKPYNQFP